MGGLGGRGGRGGNTWSEVITVKKYKKSNRLRNYAHFRGQAQKWRAVNAGVGRGVQIFWGGITHLGGLRTEIRV